ncbi:MULTISPECIES: hypothetical protein [Gordonia]|uniref:Secreted protein n=1 Tax=Gordonia amicalis TaxID=89053 RepID=A0ABU4DIS7_9ACTN|nr:MULTISPECIES: hypothetical protein [Gordonia]ATD72215.1 hypothetical protein CNO18_20085 [Gordonia sp. 1D]MBA5847315.1 hypothetical protein [Gordonia amicalis]MCZ0914776.1 hypothetical protein [Gordonia amicalis]MDV6309638.1 hypothetical protein [Gordonia amicalis]MDV7099270.1 hypothetical protein [Gordonia amicalis]
MTTVYFLIAAVALAGAGVLLWLDRQRSSVARHQRAVWGDEHEFKFRETDTKLRKVFRRATMNVADHVEVRDVAYGRYGGVETVVFDLAETATVIAVRRSSPSPVVVDLRHEDVLAPAEEDVELLGAMGPRVMFSNNLDVARRVCDRRMVALANKAPAFVEVLWNEGNWALGSLPLTNDPATLNTGLEVVRRFADLLRVLPPMREPEDSPDPRDPHGPTRAELADEKTESMRDKRRRQAAAAPATEASAAARPSAPPVRKPPATGAAQTTTGRGMAPMPVRGSGSRKPEDSRRPDDTGDRSNRHRS